MADPSQGCGRRRDRPRVHALSRRLRRDLGPRLPRRGRRRDRRIARSTPISNRFATRSFAGTPIRKRRHRVVLDGRDELPPASLRTRGPRAGRRPAGGAHRRQCRSPVPRAHVGRAGDDAGRAVPAPADRRGALGGALSRQRAYAVDAARGVAGAPVPLLDAGPVRPQVHLHRRGAWLRRDRVAADRRSRAASRSAMGAVVRLHCADGDGDGDARRIARQLATAACRRLAAAPMLMQYCHGAPGFIVCLGGLSRKRRSTRSWWPAARRSGRRDRYARARISATARPATATRSLRSTGARAMRCGLRAPARSRCTR